MSNEQHIVQGARLGRLPAKSSRKALLFRDFVKYLELPKKTNFWSRRAGIPLRSYGNTSAGSCTRSKQAVAATRMERLEQRRLIQITDEEVLRVYTEMSNELYGGGDNGAYETDALDMWRRPEKTFKDTSGRSYTIDAYLRLNHLDHDELKAAIALSGAKGIEVCFNLPWHWESMRPPLDWDAPAEGHPLIGEWMPGSWGGHSMHAHDYDEVGVWLDHTWDRERQRVTWRGMAAFCDEAHVVLDQVNAWRKQKSAAAKLNVRAVVDAVNDVSSLRIGDKH
jgi:hypothetical protein